jgi:glycosyltransferase involved in cell wall biosynthesis
VTIPVSVVVPTHNSSATIGRALRSAASQSARPCEIVVVDDASSDDTLAVVAGLARALPVPVRTIALPENLGPGTARNTGWDAATGDWVAFLDHDDAWHPEKLSLQHALMAAEPSLAMSGHLHAFRTDDDWPRVAPRPPVARFGLRDFLVRNRCSTPSVMVRREIELRFERGSSFAEDYLLWMRIVAAHGPCARIEAPLVHCTNPAFGGTGLSGRMVAMERAELRNFRVLRRERAIGSGAAAAATGWSLAKFVLRLARTSLRRFRRRPAIASGLSGDA